MGSISILFTSKAVNNLTASDPKTKWTSLSYGLLFLVHSMSWARLNQLNCLRVGWEHLEMFPHWQWQQHICRLCIVSRACLEDLSQQTCNKISVKGKNYQLSRHVRDCSTGMTKPCCRKTLGEGRFGAKPTFWGLGLAPGPRVQITHPKITCQEFSWA